VPAELKNKVAVITGGTRGIGKAVALAFAQNGADVCVVSRTAADIDETLNLLNEAAGRAIGIIADVSKKTDAGKIVQKTISTFKTIDILVNCAAVQKPIGPLVDNDINLWIQNIHINLIGTVICCKAVLPVMLRKQKGSIINFSGGGATSSRPNFSAYACSKTAIVRLTEVLAAEVKKDNVRVNAIAPGAVNTRMLDEVLHAGALAGAELEDAKQRAQKGGTSPDLAAQLAVFLASDKSEGLTGRLISAVWDKWQQFDADSIHQIMETDKYTLRRIK
jgi:NAD(P)-dependent dehydrogenase (short-subunit alcohol dehydrogenase family)